MLYIYKHHVFYKQDIFGWSNGSFQSHNILWENLNELFNNPIFYV